MSNLKRICLVLSLLVSLQIVLGVALGAIGWLLSDTRDELRLVRVLNSELVARNDALVRENVEKGKENRELRAKLRTHEAKQVVSR